ncbi:hypothetical protein KC678_03480 [Candidatus Dojkabacteria bacterium]|uniref:ATP-grasp domain-containing protein n=1 Tax=Candidatus Dojkabacteria bacterium TaxID=2099670 RepID=A0A955L1T1_9BACT|nr:hypothetical protein [Candidatus Dojkabacteria bacterium]
MFYIYPYKHGSGSVKNLKELIPDLVEIKLENSKFKPSNKKLIVNWGNSKMDIEKFKECMVLNNPLAVEIASNKLKFFNKVVDKVNIPPYTTNSEVAKEWIKQGKIVFGRSTLTGHSGDGIYEINSEEGLLKSSGLPLYTMYIPKIEEYRVHVFRGEILDTQQKRKSGKAGYVNWRVRTYGNGFIFARENVTPPQDVIDQAKLAVEVCGLDFGAVDVIWNSYRKKAYVLEVNTAPGIEETTAKNYSDKLMKYAETYNVTLNNNSFDNLIFHNVQQATVEFDNISNIETPFGYE